jgi:hypothetical protein
MTQAEIELLIDKYIKSGCRRTTAKNLRKALKLVLGGYSDSSYNLIAAEDLSEGDLLVLNSSGEAEVLDFVEFEKFIDPNSSITSGNLCEIDTNKILFVGTVAGSLSACVITISGSVVSIGSIQAGPSGSASSAHIVLTKLATDKVLFSWISSSSVYSAVASISGTTITFDSTTTFSAGSTVSGIHADLLDTDKVIITWRENTSSRGQAVIASISGTTVTFGSKAAFADPGVKNDTNDFTTSVASISTTEAVISYIDSDNSNYGACIYASVSGTTITYPNAKVSFSTSDALELVLAKKIDANNVFIMHIGANTVYGIVAQINTGVITMGAQLTINSTISGSVMTEGIDVELIDSNKLAVFYSQNLTSGNRTAFSNIITNASGTLTASSSNRIFYKYSSSSLKIRTAIASTTKILLLTDNFLVSLLNYNTSAVSIIGDNRVRFIGWAQDDALSGQTVPVAGIGIPSSVHSGLVTNAIYGYSLGGTLERANSNSAILCKALSATRLLYYSHGNYNY